jgi:hypothetical protein
MFKPSESMFAAQGRRANRRLNLVSILAVLIVPLSTVASVTNTDIPAVPGQAAPAKPAKPAGAYQIRCWQDGRLLFEESHVSLPPSDSPEYRIRLAATDRRGQPLYIAETANATCLIGRPVEERSWIR